MNKIVLLLLVFITTLFSNTQEKVSIYTKWDNQFRSAGFYMAIEKGFYKEKSLDVEVKNIKDENITKKILETKNAFGISNSSLVHEKMKGMDIVLLGAIFQNPNLALLSLEESSIKTIEDLKSKKMMLDLNIKDNSFFATMIKKNGLDNKNIHFIPSNFDINSLINRSVDSYVSYDNSELYTLERNSIKYNKIKVLSSGSKFYGDILFSSKKLVEDNPDMAREFYEASIKGWEYAFNNIDETINILNQKYNNKTFSYEKLKYEAQALKELSEIKKGKLGKIELSKINNIMSLYFASYKKFNLEVLNNMDIYSFIYQLNYEPKIMEENKKRAEKLFLEKISQPFYDMNEYKLKELFEEYLEDKEVLGIQIYDNYLYQIILSSWKDSGQVFHNVMKDFDRNIKKESILKSMEVSFNDKKLGSVTIYYRDLGKLSHMEHDYLLKKGEIKLCVAPNTMPFEDFTSSGEFIGLNASFYKIFEEKIGIPINAIALTKYFEEDFLKNKRCDIVSSIYKYDEKDFLNYTSSYLSIPIVIATKHDAAFIPYFEDLRNERIGIVKNYEYANRLKLLYPKMKLIEVNSIKEGLELVKQGKLHGQLGTLASIGYYFQKDFTGELKIAGKSDKVKLELSIGVRDDDPILYKIFQSQVVHINESVKNKIFNDWINIKVEQAVDYSLFWKGLIVVIILLGAFIYRQYLLKKLNKKLELKVEEELAKNREKDKLLFQQTKLASMGEMLNNIAHQWRQPLSSINSDVAVIDAMLMKKNAQDDDIENRLVNIESQTKYMSETIDSFRNYYSPKKIREEFTLTEVMDDIQSIVKYNLEKQNIQITVVKTKDKTINGFLGEYIQAVLAIINNSVDAFKQNKIKDAKIKVYIDDVLYIEDNAGGISEDIIDRIFEPYFTTKQQDKGTGTGLYMAKMIVEKSMNGHLNVQRINNGTRFIIKI